MLVQNTATRRKSGVDLGYVYSEVVMGLVSVIQQTPSLGKIILQTLRGGKPTRTLQDILYIILTSISLLFYLLQIIWRFREVRGACLGGLSCALHSISSSNVCMLYAHFWLRRDGYALCIRNISSSLSDINDGVYICVF